MNYLEELQKRKKYLQKQVKELQDFKELLVNAVDKFLSKKYAPLEKALQQHGGIGGIENAYGWDLISKATYQKLLDLFEEQQSDPTAQYMEEIQKHFKDRIANAEKELSSVENHIEYEETKKRYLD